MSIPGDQLKCQLAKLEEVKNKQPRIVCGLSGCFCKHVGWDQGQWMQTGVTECPKFTPTVALLFTGYYLALNYCDECKYINLCKKPYGDRYCEDFETDG